MHSSAICSRIFVADSALLKNSAEALQLPARGVYMATWWGQTVNQSRTNRIIRTSEKKPALPPSKVFYGHCAKLGAASWNNYPHGTCLTAQVTRIEGFHWKTAPPCCGETSYLLRAKKYQPHRTQTDRIKPIL